MEKQPLGGRKPELWPRPALNFLCDLGQVTSPHIRVLDLYFLTCKVSALNRVLMNTPVCLKRILLHTLLVRNDTVLPTNWSCCLPSSLCTVSKDYRAKFF